MATKKLPPWLDTKKSEKTESKKSEKKEKPAFEKKEKKAGVEKKFPMKKKGK